MSKQESIKISDYVLSPVEFITLSYSGPKPLSILKNAENIMKIGTDVATSGLFNTILKYDATDGSFYNKLYTSRGFDKFTGSKFFMELSGQQNLETNNGSIKIKIWATLDTEFPYANGLQKSLWWTYFHTYYKVYRNRCRIVAEKYVYKLRDTFTEMAGIKPEPLA